MDHVLSPLELLASRLPDGPIALARPHRIEAAAAWFRAHFSGEIFYAVKANPAPWALDALWRAGVAGFDVASEAETQLIAERFPRAKLAFMHPVKSRRAIARAYSEFGVRTFALDCEAELDKILAETNHADDLNLIVRLPALGASSAYPLGDKFGASPSEAPALLRRARAATEALMGVSFHVGSQCMRPDDFAEAMEDAGRAIVQAGILVDVVDAGGGFPAIYPGMNPPPMRLYVEAIENAFADMHVTNNAQLWIEPGRALAAEGAAVVARVELRKGDALYLNDGAFGALFDATHAGWRYPVRLLRQQESGAEAQPFRFFGPTCDSLDAAAGPFMLPGDVGEGDLIEIGQLGAYGQAMATRFNGFGEAHLIAASDAPWPSLFGPTEASAEVVQLPARKKRGKRQR